MGGVHIDNRASTAQLGFEAGTGAELGKNSEFNGHLVFNST